MKKTRKTFRKTLIQCAKEVNELPEEYKRMTANEIFDSISAKGHLLIARNLNEENHPDMDWDAVEEWLARQLAEDLDENGDFLAHKYIEEMKVDKDLVPGIANLAYAVREYLLSNS